MAITVQTTVGGQLQKSKQITAAEETPKIM